MKKYPSILWGLLSFFPSLVFAVDGRPVECLYSGSGGKKATAGQQRVAICQEFDLAFKNNYSNVCIFKNNMWQYGNLTYNKKTQAHDFKYKQVCDLGVNAVKEEDPVNIKSPSIIDAVKRTDYVTVKGSIYTAIKQDHLKENEVPSVCYLRATAGKPREPRPCNLDPNASEYCELVNFDKGYYRGKWWVFYRAANKKSPTYCLGGMRAVDVTKAKNEYGEFIDIVRNTTLDANSYANRIASLQPSMDMDPYVGFKTAACIQVNGTKETRLPCANSEAPLEAWTNNEDAYKAKLLETIEAERITFQLNGPKKTASRKLAISMLQLELNRKNLTEAKKATLEAELSAIKEKISDEFDSRLAAANGVYPVFNTTYVDKGCYASWMNNDAAKIFSPETPNKVFYITRNNKGVISKTYCGKVEISEIMQPTTKPTEAVAY